MMMIPIIIAVYFIGISFRQNVSIDRGKVTTAFRTKIMLALLFVAVVPTLPITIISNNIVNKAISELFISDTQSVLTDAVLLARENISRLAEELNEEKEWFRFSALSGYVDPVFPANNNYIARVVGSKGVFYRTYTILSQENYNHLQVLYGAVGDKEINSDLDRFVSYLDLSDLKDTYRIVTRDKTLLVTCDYTNGRLSLFYRPIPESYLKQVRDFEKYRTKFEQRTFFLPYIQDAVGLFLLLLAIVVIITSVALSYFLSRNITKPINELVDASHKVAKGDFSIQLKVKTADEISLLYASFNEMVRQLGESRHALLHMQKLAAWKEVGSKLLHEIKNPLTPIRLSAERIKRKYFGSSADMDQVIQTGTETIIEEVDSLQRILKEFSSYTRLPSLEPEPHSINEILQNCANLFHGHEKITFHFFLDDDLPLLNIDKGQMRQVFINIIKNAIEALKYEGNISFSTRLSDSSVVITVGDDGPGIAAKDISQLFEPTFSRKPNGTGLGLAIVDKIIVEHGGEIYCQSGGKNFKGAEFIITLPMEIISDGKSTDSR